MSHEIEEQYDAWSFSTRRAAKDHRCSACGLMIEKGNLYRDVRVVFDGHVDVVKRCGRCEAMHAYLVFRGNGETWPDERLGCGESYQEHWDEEPPASIEMLPFLTPGEASALLAALS